MPTAGHVKSPIHVIWWLVLAVIAALLGLRVWVVVVLHHERSMQAADVEDRSAEALAALPVRRDPVEAFSLFVERGGPLVGVEREATSRAVVGMAQAISMLTEASGLDSLEVRVALLDLSARGRALAQVGPDRLTHADIAREAFVWASSLLTTLQEQRDPTDSDLASRVAQLAVSARTIRADEPLPGQHQAVLRFFREAADVLQRLARTTPHEALEPTGT